jgi:hypothetical protein
MRLADTIVELLRALRESRRERDIYREIALSAIHRLHDQHVQIATQRSQIQDLCRELRARRTPRASASTPPKRFGRTDRAPRMQWRYTANE